MKLTAQDQLEANRGDEARAAVAAFRSFGIGWQPPISISAESVRSFIRPEHLAKLLLRRLNPLQ